MIRRVPQSRLPCSGEQRLEFFDLEYDVQAFNDQLPRVRIIRIDEFDPADFL